MALLLGISFCHGLSVSGVVVVLRPDRLDGDAVLTQILAMGDTALVTH
jgi:hypothetical protein